MNDKTLLISLLAGSPWETIGAKEVYIFLWRLAKFPGT